MTDLGAQLRESVSGTVLADEPLAGYTTLKVGGPAEFLVRVETTDDLQAVATLCAEYERPWLIVGRGSNLLVADDGWPGVAVVLGKGFRGVEFDSDEPDALAVGTSVGVVAGAAEPMPVLATTVAARGLAGLAFGVAIPGTLGGAVRMNAGAHGGEVGDVLDWAEVVRLGRAGEIERLPAASLAMTYRHTTLPADAVVARARVTLTRADDEQLATEMADMKRWRREHQPTNSPSCGSVFRNPTGDSAGRLIEAAGLKGHRVGGAQVSPVHANFITVAQGATAADVHDLIRTVQEQVRRRHQVELDTEVVVVGFGPSAPVVSGDGGGVA